MLDCDMCDAKLSCIKHEYRLSLKERNIVTQNKTSSVALMRWCLQIDIVDKELPIDVKMTKVCFLLSLRYVFNSIQSPLTAIVVSDKMNGHVLEDSQTRARE